MARGLSVLGGVGAILFYHRIAKLSPDSHGLCVSPKNFRAHMEHVRRRCCPLSLDDVTEAACRGDVPEGAVAVTLDDGYLDALTTASGVLTDLGIPATFFVNTDRLDEPHEFLWDAVERIFLGGAPLPPKLEIQIGGGRLRHPTATPEQRAAAHTMFTEHTHRLSAGDREEAVKRLGSWSGLDLAPRESHRPLVASELIELAGRPAHSVGAHTTHHLSLPAQPIDVQRHEVQECRMRLETLLGCSVRSFSYPYGECGVDTVEVVREAAFSSAVTCEAGLVRLGADPLRLPRLEVRDWDRVEFAGRLRRLFSVH